MVSGDSHYMRVDKPLTDQYPACLPPTATSTDCKPFDAALDARGNTVLNFTRLEVPGSANVHWALAHIRPTNRNLFQFEFMIVPDVPTGTGIATVITGPGAASAATSFETTNKQILLDASKSTSSNSGDLTYSWTSSPGYPTAAITGTTTPTPLVQFGARGVYQLTLTITDRTGLVATTTVTVRYS
jgi:hypothetical protein